MGKTRDCLKKTGDIKGTFHERMGTIKDRNSKDLTEAQLKKKWQECTEELNKKGLNDLDNHNSVVTHLEPDILEHEVNWVLGSVTTTKASGGDRISAEVFKLLKDDAVKVLHSICQKIGKLGRGQGLEKVSFHSKPKEGQCQRMFKIVYRCTHFTCQQGDVQNPSN